MNLGSITYPSSPFVCRSVQSDTSEKNSTADERKKRKLYVHVTWLFVYFDMSLILMNNNFEIEGS